MHHLKVLLLVAISLISFLLAADENVLRTESISIAVSNTDDGREKTTSFDGSKKGEVIKRTLTVSASGGDIKDVNVLAGGGMTVVSEDKNGLTITGLQMKGSDIGDFEMVVSGRVVPKTSSTGKGKGDATPPKEDPWNFSGTGKYSIGKCTNGFNTEKIMLSLPNVIAYRIDSTTYIFSLEINSKNKISSLLDKLNSAIPIIDEAGNKITAAGMFRVEVPHKSCIVSHEEQDCLVCSGLEFQAGLEYAYSLDTPVIYMPDWKEKKSAGTVAGLHWSEWHATILEHEISHFIDYENCFKTFHPKPIICKKNCCINADKEQYEKLFNGDFEDTFEEEVKKQNDDFIEFISEIELKIKELDDNKDEIFIYDDDQDRLLFE